jgi:methyl coenzyme M reductase beta subunit
MGGSSDSADRVGEFNSQELLDVTKQKFESNKAVGDLVTDVVKDNGKQTGALLSQA